METSLQPAGINGPKFQSFRNLRLGNQVYAQAVVVVGADGEPITSGGSGGSTVEVTNFPQTQVITGIVEVANFPAPEPFPASFEVSNFPTAFQVSNFPAFPATQTVAGTVAVSNFPATQSVSGTVSVGNFPASFQVSNFPATQQVSGTVAVSNFPGTSGVALFSGRVSSFRTPGRAGTTGQKLFALHNATASPVVVRIKELFVDAAFTVVKAITVQPPIIRVHRVTALPTGGTALSKVKIDSTLNSSASVTVFGDASADGTVSNPALAAVIPANSVLAQEFAPRFITAAGYEMMDRTTFFGNEGRTIRLGTLEGIVVELVYTLATQNPVTDMWIVTCDFDEFAP